MRGGAGGSDCRALSCVLVAAGMLLVYRVALSPVPCIPTSSRSQHQQQTASGADGSSISISALASSGGVGAISESEKVRCYNWLETDMQDCEYIMRWLQQNNADEDRRTGYTPSAVELAERKVVSQKSLFCQINPVSQRFTFAQHQKFSDLLFPKVPSDSAEADRIAASVDAAKCPTCPSEKACAARCPPAPAAAPEPEPEPEPVVATPSAAAVKRPLGPGEVPPSKEKRVIAYGLYGNQPRYIQGAFRNAELAPSVMPGWVVRFYHDNSVPRDVLDRLQALGCELRLMTTIHGGIAGMFWRFLVADDATVDRYIVRDSDSRLTAREALAVQEWIDSGKKYHILRDHPSHSNFKISGGIWGGVHDPTLRMEQRMGGHRNKDAYVEDMNFLANSVYPLMTESLLAHDAYSCSACADPQYASQCRWGSFPHSVPFPTPRVGAYHCGQVFDGNTDIGRAGDMDIIRNSPPPAVCTPTFPYAPK